MEGIRQASRKKKTITIIVILSGLLLSLSGCQKKEQKKPEVARPVKTIVITGPQTTIIRSFPGKVYANREVDLAFQVEGKLLQFPVDEGQELKESQLIGQLEQDQYRDVVTQAKAKYHYAKSQYLRGKKLITGDFISKADYDKLKSNYDVATAELSKAKRDLGYTTLIAPFEGVVSKKYVDRYEFVKPKQKIISFQDISQVDIKVDIPEDIILNIKKGNKVAPTASFVGAPGINFPVTLKEFSAEADPETQTFTVVYTMKQPQTLNVLPGMSATIKLTLPDFKAGGKAFIEIPSSAVFVGVDSQPLVWRVNPKTMTLQKNKVTITRLAQDKVRVTSGLKEGDRIVTAGVHYLREGQKVTLWQPKVKKQQ